MIETGEEMMKLLRKRLEEIMGPLVFLKSESGFDLSDR